MLSQLLAKFNLNYEDLNAAEKETLNEWVHSLETNELTLEKVKDYMKYLIEAVEREMATYDLSKNQDLFLKARLKNYLMISDFLTSPDKARKHIEQSIQAIKK